MGNCCIVLGKSGSGKSTSIKGLNPKETVIINVLNKKLPFKGSDALYNAENSNIARVETHTDLIAWLDGINKQCPHVKNIVIDDAIFIMSKEFFKRAKETGYGKFTDLAVHYQQIMTFCESLRGDLNIFFMLHAEDVRSDNTIVGFKVRTIGKLLDDQYSIVEVVPMVLYAHTLFDEKGKASYGFYTHKSIVGGVEIPAKTPDEMFAEDWIPNDLGLVIQAMKEYYA